MEYIGLSNGLNLPAIGFGPGIVGYSSKYVRKKTGILSIPGRAYNKLIRRPICSKKYANAISEAIRTGYRLIDYSAAYGNGSLIAKGIKNSGVHREDLILTTRVSNRAQFAGPDAVKKEFFSQLKGMNTDYIDIEKLFYLTEERPFINQFEIHPLFTQKKLIDFCRKNNIQPEAYTPVARFDDRLVRLPVLHKIADKYNKTVLQVVLRWHVQNKIIPVVRAMSPSHQKENFDIFDFQLSREEMQIIDRINLNSRLRYDPDNCDFTIL